MPKRKLDRLETLPLRDVFADEPSDFTPWLADNLDLLGGEIRLDLVREDTEVPIGDFSLDILASASAFGAVAIENQLGQSDHDHLGKLLTYAAGMSAKAAVWVAPEFRTEHLDAVNALNEWAESALALFAVEVRALRIGKSSVGVEFRAIASPKDWTRRQKSTSQPVVMSDNEREARVDFFDRLARGALERKLTDSTGFSNVAKSKSFRSKVEVDGKRLKYWIDLPMRGGVTVTLDVRTGDTRRNDAIISRLAQEESAIEQVLDFQPVLVRPDPEGPHGLQAGRVTAFRPASINDSPERIDETLEWCLKVLGGFQMALEPRLQKIIDGLAPKQADGVEDDPLGNDID